jgi:hypothetical protein
MYQGNDLCKRGPMTSSLPSNRRKIESARVKKHLKSMSRSKPEQEKLNDDETGKATI